MKTGLRFTGSALLFVNFGDSALNYVNFGDSALNCAHPVAIWVSYLAAIECTVTEINECTVTEIKGLMWKRRRLLDGTGGAYGFAIGLATYEVSGMIWISTRRLRARPGTVAFEAAGYCSPKPWTYMRWDITPFCCRT